MIYNFASFVFAQGNRAFAAIPFNVWEETGLKGNLPCRVTVGGSSFECKLVPKGGGKYLIPVPKKLLPALEYETEYEFVLEPLETLTRINNNSPYSREHPVRRIDGIDAIPVQSGLCGHCCVAMLAGVPLPEVTALMGKGHASWSKILEALDYYGIAYAPKAVYTKGGAGDLPRCCIVNNDNGFLLWYDNAFCGVSDVDPAKTVSYIEVFTD